MLFVDEPTSGLDSKMARSVIEILQSLAHDEGRTVEQLRSNHPFLHRTFPWFLTGDSVYMCYNKRAYILTLV